MPDVPAITGAVSTTWAGRKVLGPTLDKMGEQLRDRYSKFSEQNLTQIVMRAERLISGDADKPGEFSPRVLLKVLDEGAWCEAPVMAEYFGGILAASRSEDGRDDRGTSWASLVARLASFDISMHYLIYDSFRGLFVGTPGLNLGFDADRSVGKTGIYVPVTSLLQALQTGGHPVDINEVVTPSISALVREGLLGPNWTLGDSETLSNRHRINVSVPGIVVEVSLPGLQLFNWAHGKPHGNANTILVSSEVYEVSDDIKHLDGALKVSDLCTVRAERIKDETGGKPRPSNSQGMPPRT